MPIFQDEAVLFGDYLYHERETVTNSGSDHGVQLIGVQSWGWAVAGRGVVENLQCCRNVVAIARGSIVFLGV